jgi:hypothetical protein
MGRRWPAAGAVRALESVPPRALVLVLVLVFLPVVVQMLVLLPALVARRLARLPLGLKMGLLPVRPGQPVPACATTTRQAVPTPAQGRSPRSPARRCAARGALGRRRSAGLASPAAVPGFVRAGVRHRRGARRRG